MKLPKNYAAAEIPSHQPIDRYLGVMTDLQARTEFIKILLNSQTNRLEYRSFHWETLALQFRKVFEQIALASLVANKEKYAEVNTSFHKDYNAADIVRKLKTLNRYFYPQPINLSLKEGVWVVDYKTEGFMTPKQLVLAHGRCGDVLHSKNPFGKPLDLSYIETHAPEWYLQVVRLLDTHLVNLQGQNRAWVVKMVPMGQGTPEVLTIEIGADWKHYDADDLEALGESRN